MNKEPGILPTDLKIYWLMQKYRKRNHSPFIRGRYCYDIQKAIRNEPLVKEFFSDQPDKLSRMLYKIKRAIAKGYIECEEYEIIRNWARSPKKNILDTLLSKKKIKLIDVPLEPFVKKTKVLGNIDINNYIFDEMRSLILKGENLKDHSSRLQRKYNMKKKDITGVWDYIYEPYKNMSEEEFKFEKKVAELMKYTKLPRRRIKKQSHKIAKEISPKEYKERFGHFPDPK